LFDPANVFHSDEASTQPASFWLRKRDLWFYKKTYSAGFPQVGDKKLAKSSAANTPQRWPARGTAANSNGRGHRAIGPATTPISCAVQHVLQRALGFSVSPKWLICSTQRRLHLQLFSTQDLPNLSEIVRAALSHSKSVNSFASASAAAAAASAAAPPPPPPPPPPPNKQTNNKQFVSG
jgi:hypothetical protein